MSSLKRTLQLQSDSVWSSFSQNQADIAHLSSSIRQTSSLNSSSRLTIAQDSILLKKQKIRDSNVITEMTGDEGLSTSSTAVFPHNDSQKLNGVVPKLNKISLDDSTENLLNETNLRVCFEQHSISMANLDSCSSAEFKTKLARWPGMSNLNLDVGVSDSQFISSLAPLLEQIPSERKPSVKDKIYRVLLGEMSQSTPNPKLWSSEEKIPTIVISPSTAVLQTFMKDAQKLILNPSEHFYAQSTPISKRKTSPLSGHFPLSSSLNWSQSELDF